MAVPTCLPVNASGVKVNAAKGVVNHLRAVIRNVGDVAATGAKITFKFAPYFAGLSDSDFEEIGHLTDSFTPGQTTVEKMD